jgi:hypothetical protein
MHHYCPECEDESSANGGGAYYDCMETYGCEKCLDVYCVHFMKTISPRVCWICGSEKLVPLFEALAEKWHKETGYHSNSGYTHTHPAYQGILAIGKPAIPLIIKDIQNGARTHWFHAIRHIIGDGPQIPEESRGRIKVMEEIYLDWLAKKGV